MHIRNRISDIKKIRCNACQDYLKMVAVEDWKNQLYEKTQIAVKYSPAKYKPAYKIMRTRGIENYEIDDMDVTFISEVIHKCSYIFPSKVETRKAIEQLTEDRNVNGHSDENEECEELYRYAFLSLTNLQRFIDTVDEYYYMHDYFGEHLESYWKDGDKATRISQFTVMTMADFLKYDNIRLPMIADDFKLLPCSEEIINEANLLMLEMIKAYDKSKNDELLVTAKKINDWLQEHPKLIGREVCIINKYQIKIRKTYLGYSDKAELFSIIEKSENNNYRAGAFILLGEFDEAKKIFDSYGEEQMQEFINYPIYTLYQQSGENLM